MKIAMIIVRTLMGLLFLLASTSYFAIIFGYMEMPPMEGPVRAFNEGLAAAGYFFILLKLTELTCGFLLVIGRFVPLALVVLSPIIINILMVNLFLDRSGLPIAVFLVLADIFLAYYYRESFAPLLKSKYVCSKLTELFGGCIFNVKIRRCLLASGPRDERPGV